MDIKKYTEKALKVTKQATNTIKDITSNIIEEEKEKYHENQIKGVDNWDDKLKKWVSDKGLSATFAKWSMNRNMKRYKKEEEIERGEPREGWFTLLWHSFGAFFGIGGYLVFIFLMLGIALIIFSNILNIIEYLPLILLIKYISIHIKYNSNAKYFDYKWYLDLVKEDEKYVGKTARLTYLEIPAMFYTIDSELEDYLEKRGKKNMVSGQRECASISNSRIEYDEVYGWIRVFQIDNKFFKKSVTNLEDVELTDYFLIPQCTSLHALNTEVYYSVHDEVKQSIDCLLGLKSLDSFIETIASDNNINQGFGEIAELIEKQKEEENQRLQKEKEETEKKELFNYVEKYKLPKKAVDILQYVKKNKEELGFSYWNLNGEGIKGNDNYLKIKMQLLGNTTYDTAKKSVPLLKSKFRSEVVIQEDANDKKCFYVIVLFKMLIDRFAMKPAQLKKYNDKDQLFLGRGLTGDVVADFTKNSYFVAIGGKAGSGKSVQMMNLIEQTLSQKSTKYNDLFIISASKLGDYYEAEFDKKGALLQNATQKVDKAGNVLVSEEEAVLRVYNIFKYIEHEAERRESLFIDESVKNIEAYNEKHPEEPLSRILFVVDEWESLRRKTKNMPVPETLGKGKYGALLDESISNILSLVRASGVNVFLATQSLLKDDIGKAFDGFTVWFGGRNEANVWSTLDKTNKIAGFYKTLIDNKMATEGAMFYKSDVLNTTEQQIEFASAFSQIQTPYIDNKDIAKDLNVKFDTHLLADEIFSKNILEENSNEEEKIGVDLF